MSAHTFIDEDDRSTGSTTTILPSVSSDETSHSHRNALFCALIVMLCALLTNPVANMPFSDEFSYDKTALEFARTGHILYNGWATAMLGWLIPWGALVIKVFGFSFTVMRLSMLPIDAATVYLFHQILRRFGINPRNAVFGTLAFALSPIFMPSATSFMTDIPGMFVIFVCLYMCQAAVAAATDRAALLWLTCATVFNVAAGTVRQIAWLGALVMVPSTIWLLRRRRGMKGTGVALWIFSFVGVLLFRHWFNSQPYSVPEHIIWAPIRWVMLPHLAAQLVKTTLCLLLVILPVSVAWLPSARSLPRKAWLRIACVMGLSISFGIVVYALGRIDTWTMPWLNFLLPQQSSLTPGMFGTPVAMVLWIRIAISLLVIASGLILAEQMVSLKRNRPPGSAKQATSWNELAWILGPFSFSYILLLMPRGAFDLIQDRYLVGLVPSAIVFLLRLYQERIRAKLPVVSLVALAVFAVYSVAGTHDFFAESRAEVTALHMVESSGVPRRAIQTGFPDDGWVQIQNGGHINEPRIRVPAGAYNPAFDSNIPERCSDGFTKFTPTIHSKYLLLSPWFKNPPDPPPPSWCFVPANYPPIHYTTWLPPFYESMYVKKLANGNAHPD
jgi:hypothetical protein